MTGCPSCFNTSCPEVTPEITISQTILALDTGDAAVEVEDFAAQSGTTVVLSETPISGFQIMVYVNGALQQETVHWAYALIGVDPTITFTFTLASDDVQVKYAFAV